MRSVLLAAVGLALTGGALAAQHQHQQSPYADLKGREIKALSAEELQQYEAGEGMGLALAAELNRYPGPRHALELAEDLGLSDDQTRRVQEIRDEMSSRAVRLGRQIVAHERELDRAFADRTIDDARLQASTAEIGRLQGALRFAHLRAHLAMVRILSSEQVSRYEMLRGYAH